MKYITKIVSLTLLTSLTLFTQKLLSQNIKGKVYNNQNNSIAGVNIYIKSIGIGTTTNSKGEYFLNYAARVKESDSITFSFVGYKTQHLSLLELKKRNYMMIMDESVQPIKEVSISSEKKQLKLQIAYTKLEPLKNGLFAYGSILHGNNIWVIGGDKSYESGRGLRDITTKKPSFSYESYSDKLHTYNIILDKWSTPNLKFCKRAYHNIHYYNDKIFVIGGKKLSTNRKKEYLANEIEIFNINDNTILTDNTNPHQAVNFASFVYNDNLIVMGGSTKRTKFEEKICTNKAHLLNLKSGLWYELADMPTAKETKGILMNNTIYLVGGFNKKPLDNIEVYNITTGEWKVLGQLFYEVERPALAMNGSTIYIFEDGRIQTYNTDTKELKLFSIDLPLTSSEMFYQDSKLYLLGGCIGDDSYKAPTSNLYCIDIKEFNTSAVYNSKKL